MMSDVADPACYSIMYDDRYAQRTTGKEGGRGGGNLTQLRIFFRILLQISASCESAVPDFQSHDGLQTLERMHV